MKIEQQVISLPLAKKLAGLGVKKEGIFAYVEQNELEPWLSYYENPIFCTDEKYTTTYTASELMQMLPETILGEKGAGYLFVEKWNDDYAVYYSKAAKVGDKIIQLTLAEALGEMLVWLIEQKLVNVEE